MVGQVKSFGWAKTDTEWREVAAFFVDVIAADPSYISHGEIQTALSLDGVSWAPDLAERFRAEIGDASPDRGLLAGRDAAGRIVAAASVTWSEDHEDAPFATIQDMAVASELRSSGVGSKMLVLIEAEALKRGMKWLFLESGKRNERAHKFFERHGLKEISHVFAKRL